MYSIVLVDDEAPTLRFLQAIIEKYAKDYTVAAAFQSGEAALDYFSQHTAHLLMTDISMPGINGITLAQKVRALHPDMHMMIISGYAEFEYAKGAIQAAVDDYTLKPVSLPHMTEVLARIKEKLDEEAAAKQPAMLRALLAGQPYDKALAAQLFGEEKYYLALVRWGNLYTSQDIPHTPIILNASNPALTVLHGRDEDEHVLLMKADKPAADFQAAVKAYALQRKNTATITALFARNSDSYDTLPVFYRRASRLMEQSVSIGRHQFIFLTNDNREVEIHIPGAILKKLEHFLQSGNVKMIKDIFITLAADWEKRQLPQFCAATMVQQLTNLVFLSKTTPVKKQTAVMQDTRDLLRYAISYGDLMASLYAILFDEDVQKDKKLSSEALYEYAVQYIQEKYAEPLSILNVCAEIGISQTYLSRLFRKYGNTSFNVFLTQCRIENAMTLIRRHPDILLRDVAACVGYDDSAYFSKVFHQTTGYSPSQWALEVSEGRI